ncbi:hypothetical protein [Paenibacillus sp. MMO-58]|uniref:hypothetical protein n=1 Tax=Paenibacillus sp. MMO-58 TaxID=3081290 RepID=UPI0030164F1F
MEINNKRLNLTYARGKILNVAIYSVVLIYAILIARFILSYFITNRIFLVSQLCAIGLFIVAVISMLWLAITKKKSERKVGVLGRIIRYDYRNKETNQIYTNLRVHLDQMSGLKLLRSISSDREKVLIFLIDFLNTLLSIKEGKFPEWPRPMYINATSYKLREHFKVVIELQLQLTIIESKSEKFKAAFLSAFIENSFWNLKMIKRSFFKNYKSPLYDLRLGFQELEKMDLQSWITYYEAKLKKHRTNKKIPQPCN